MMSYSNDTLWAVIESYNCITKRSLEAHLCTMQLF